MPTRAECPAYLLPVPHLRPGDELQCPVCGQRVGLREPLASGPFDRWNGLADARIDQHFLEATLGVEPAS